MLNGPTVHLSFILRAFASLTAVFLSRDHQSGSGVNRLDGGRGRLKQLRTNRLQSGTSCNEVSRVLWFLKTQFAHGGIVCTRKASAMHGPESQYRDHVPDHHTLLTAEFGSCSFVLT